MYVRALILVSESMFHSLHPKGRRPTLNSRTIQLLEVVFGFILSFWSTFSLLLLFVVSPWLLAWIISSK